MRSPLCPDFFVGNSRIIGLREQALSAFLAVFALELSHVALFRYLTLLKQDASALSLFRLLGPSQGSRYPRNLLRTLSSVSSPPSNRLRNHRFPSLSWTGNRWSRCGSNGARAIGAPSAAVS